MNPLRLMLLPLLATMIWAGNTIVSKLSAGAIEPAAISFYRWLIALIALTPFMLPRVWALRASVRPHLGKLIVLSALVGMGAKAGVMPLHVWLPRAHPIAPAPVSALMSGVMIKVAIYALVRVLVDWVGVVPLWIGVLVLGLGALSAVGGVVYALFQHDLKRLLALHSIENIGILFTGVGLCAVFFGVGMNALASLTLVAVLYHALNHAFMKSLLFVGHGLGDINIRYLLYKLHKLRARLTAGHQRLPSAYLTAYGAGDVQRRLLAQWDVELIELDPLDKTKSTEAFLESLL